MRKDIYIPNVDMDILKLQYDDLLDAAVANPESTLSGLLGMIDFMLEG